MIAEEKIRVKDLIQPIIGFDALQQEQSQFRDSSGCNGYEVIFINPSNC